MTMGIKDLIQLLREDGLNCVAGELSTGELQYLAADALLAYEKENAILKYKIECHVETILQYKEEVERLKKEWGDCDQCNKDFDQLSKDFIRSLQAENAKLRKVVEAAETLMGDDNTSGIVSYKTDPPTGYITISGAAWDKMMQALQALESEGGE